MKKLLITAACLLLLAGCNSHQVKSTQSGVVVTTADGGRVRVEAISDKILRVSSTPDDFSKRESLVAIAQQQIPQFTIETLDSIVTLRTAAASATIDRKSGRVSIFNANGEEILCEREGGRTFEPLEVDGESGYTTRQVFESPDNEAFYGLGQHQSNEFNYKSKNETLYQYNTKVSVPFIVSNRNYGLLWDNYSLTRWGDPRDYAQLDEVFAIKQPIKAIYTDAKGGRVERDEQRLDYADLEKIKSFPTEFLPRFYGSQISWDGQIEAKQSGIHRFILYYAGYTKVFVDGKEVVPEVWRTAWNPNSVKFEIQMEQGRSYPLRVEWKPDGGVSYISLKALTPVEPQEQARQSWWSELGDQIDYYVVVGENADQVISGYRTLTGKSQIMPRWAMGFWQSRERYKTQDQLLGALDGLRKRGIGVDNIVLDWSYWREDAWGSHDMDPERFPDPKAMIDSIHKQNAQIMISVWPKFYHTTEHYREFKDMGAMYPRAVQDSIKDWIADGYIGSFYDAYNPEARKLFWEQMSEHLFTLGIDAWWMDASEPDILSNASLEYRKELSSPTWLGSSVRYLNPYSLVNAQAIYEGQRGEKPNQRVFLLTRSGYAGLQRYSTATWSGDIGTCWEDMQAQIPAGLNFALSGVPYWTQDIGGFCVQRKFETAREGSPEMEEWRELNARWHQWGAFCPLYRAHGQFPAREFYNIAPESHPAYKSMLYYNQLRYRMMPYIYTMASRTWFDDYTIMRALVMDFAEDKKVLNIGDQFMFGDAMMVCPVTKFKAREREVYLPATCGWYDFYTDKYMPGAQSITADAPYERSPLYIKAGSIIPMGRQIVYSSQPTDGFLNLNIYTGGDVKYTLYEDDGVSYNYENGDCSRIPMQWNEAKQELTIEARDGRFEGMISSRPIEVRVVSPKGIKSAKTTYNGEAQTLKFN